jgi:hypothetical protein
LDKISLQLLAVPVWRWVILVIPALAIAFWSYYRILAPITRPARWVLWTLRGLAFLLVLFALCQPVLTAVLRDSGKPGLAVLIDRSGSMALPTSGRPVTRLQEAEDIARRVQEEVGGRYRMQWYSFADRVRTVRPDSTDSASGNTALGQAMEEVLTQEGSHPVNGMLIVSDGVNTAGRDPVRIAAASPVPVFTVAVGPQRAPVDVGIRSVRSNPTAFSGEPLPIQAVVSSWGLAGRSVRVEVREKGAVLAGKDVSLMGDQGLEQEVDFEIRPRMPGLTLYEVAVSGVTDSIPQDDKRLLAVNVLERKTGVLVLAPRVDWDFAFLKRAFSADTTLAYTYLAETRPNEFESSGEKKLRGLPTSVTELKDFAAVILCGLDEKGLPASTLEAVARFVQEGGGLLVIGGPARPQAWTTSGAFADALPATVAPDLLPNAPSLPVSLTLEGQRHPATAVSENPAETAQLWSSLAPLFRPGGSLVPRPGAKDLLDYRPPRGASTPALAVSFRERGKTAWLYGRGIWRWGFTPPGSEAVKSDLYRQFLMGMTRWLAEPVLRERFQLNPGKRVYQNGEPVTFAASM